MDQQTLPILDKNFVEQLIPQKSPFVMIDKLISFSENQIESGLKVTAENIFVENTVFQESGLIEHMAQSVALYTGYQYYLKQKPAPIGYIGAIKAIEIVQMPKIGDEVETTVNVLQEFMGVTLVEISSKINDVKIAYGQMKTVLAS